MSIDYDSFANRGEYFAAHYFAEQLETDLKKGLLARWTNRETDAVDTRATPREALRSLRGEYLSEGYRGFFAERAQQDAQDDEDSDGLRAGRRLNTHEDGEWRERVAAWHQRVLASLGFPGAERGSDTRRALTVHKAGRQVDLPVAWHGDGIIALDCGWAASNDTALDADGSGRLLHPLRVTSADVYDAGQALATWLFQAELEEEGGPAPRFVLLLCGGVLVLADRLAWAEGRYLAVSLDAALERNDRKQTGELAVLAALFSHEMLAPGEDGKGAPLDALLKSSRENAVGVSGELRKGLQRSVEIIANEVLERMRVTGLEPRELEGPDLPFAKDLTRESLRYLYRILFLLYAEARPELGILPADDGSYEAGYSVARLRDLVSRDEQLVEEEARSGVHLYESLAVLFDKVNHGHRPWGTEADDDLPGDDEETRKLKAKCRSEARGLRFEPLRSELFEPGSVRLIGCVKRVGEADQEDAPTFDLRLRNVALHEVLRLLMMKRATRRGERGGFISYRNLGINQLGAVYEGLMSYTGIIATEELCEVAKGGDPEKGSWLVPSRRQDDYPKATLVQYDELDALKGLRGVKKYPAGSFVYRLAGRDRETSASYYTPESLTRVTVELALKHRLDQERDEHGAVVKTRASELLKFRICEPALGSGAFLNEAINQVAEEYLRRREEELSTTVPTSTRLTEKQKVKAYIALHNSYGVDLNATGVELAEVSLWLNTMHPGMRAPWFGLHLRRGNSLIGGRRAVYAGADVASGAAVEGKLTPTHLPLPAVDSAPMPMPSEAVHQFLLPSSGWGAVTRASGDAKKLLTELASEEVKQLTKWRRGVAKAPKRQTNKDGSPKLDPKTRSEKPSQFTRLGDLARRAEFLWGLVVKRMELSEREVARSIDMWGADLGSDEYAFLRRTKPETTSGSGAGAAPLTKEQVYADLFNAKGTPYWRLKQVMNAWCALWFWPVGKVGLLDGTDDEYSVPGIDVAALLAGLPLVGEPEAIEESVDKGAASFEVITAVAPTPQYAAPTALFTIGAEQTSFEDLELRGDMEGVVEAAVAAGSNKGKLSGVKTKALAGPKRREKIPLKELEDWIEFLEAMLGATDLPDGTVLDGLRSLQELSELEDELPVFMQMDQADVESRFPWMHVVNDIADEQGFLHWELDFALAFAEGGGFDLQVGNPPWVRPEWKEDPVLAEYEPWFMLTEKASAAEKDARRTTQLKRPEISAYTLREATETVVIAEYLSDWQVYPLITGSQPDLYRAFMCQTWEHSAAQGSIGMLHRDTHFSGKKEARLRAASYRRLRVHGGFFNAGNRFFPDPVSRALTFGVHIYGPSREISFDHLSWLFSADALLLSSSDDGTSPDPGVKYENDWDERPHLKRVIRVTRETLALWQRLTGEGGDPSEARLLSPVSTSELKAISALASFPTRLGDLNPHITRGLDESSARKNQHGPQGNLPLIDFRSNKTRHDFRQDSWEEVIIKGPQIGVANPLFKTLDSETGEMASIDLLAIKDSFVPSSEYVRGCEKEIFRTAQDTWLTHVQSPPSASTTKISLPQNAAPENAPEASLAPYTDFYRIAWREMISANREQVLLAAIIPPGPAHIHAVRSGALEDNRMTALWAGFWSSMPLDYLLRTTGVGHLDVSGARNLPVPSADHPLASALLLRTLRLNCLTKAYEDLWHQLYDPSWSARETWARSWAGMRTELSTDGAAWELATPLRTDRSRRAALVEIDALVAVWLGVSADALATIFQTRMSIMQGFDAVTWFDANERKIAGDRYTYGFGQEKEHWTAFQAYLKDPEGSPVPDGYVAPFFKADREKEMREAHAYFQARLDAAVQAGLWDPVTQTKPATARPVDLPTDSPEAPTS